MATDSRAVYGEDMHLMREAERKIEVVDNRFCISILGSIGIATKVVEDIRAEFQKRRTHQTTPFVELCEDAAFKATKRYGERIQLSDEDYDFDLACVSSDGIFAITRQGISEKEEKYFAFGSSDLYGEYILRQLYKAKPTFDEAARWATYAIKQAMLLDPAVGGPIQLAFVTTNGVRLLTADEVSKIENKVVGESPEFQRDLLQLVDGIVDYRRKLNQWTQQEHGFSPFNQREAEIWALAHPVVIEEDFTNRILAVGILIDEMTFQLEGDPKARGSIDELEAWMKKTSKSSGNASALTAILRQIRTLRNTSFPVHPANAEYVTVIVGWGLSFPPDWARLYHLVLEKYLQVLKQIATFLGVEK